MRDHDSRHQALRDAATAGVFRGANGSHSRRKSSLKAPPRGVDVPLRRPESAGQALLEHLSPGAGFSRRRDGIIPLDLPGQAHGRGGVLRGDRRLACFEAFQSRRTARLAKSAMPGTGSCPLGHNGKETFVYTSALPPGGGAGAADNRDRRQFPS